MSGLSYTPGIRIDILAVLLLNCSRHTRKITVHTFFSVFAVNRHEKKGRRSSTHILHLHSILIRINERIVAPY